MGAMLLAGCGDSHGSALERQIVEGVERDPQSVRLGDLDAGVIVCPYDPVETLDEPVRRAVEAAGFDTNFENRQWIVTTGAQPRVYALGRDRVDLCFSRRPPGAFTAETRFRVGGGTGKANNPWVLTPVGP